MEGERRRGLAIVVMVLGVVPRGPRAINLSVRYWHEPLPPAPSLKGRGRVLRVLLKELRDVPSGP